MHIARRSGYATVAEQGSQAADAADKKGREHGVAQDNTTMASTALLPRWCARSTSTNTQRLRPSVAAAGPRCIRACTRYASSAVGAQQRRFVVAASSAGGSTGFDSIDDLECAEDAMNYGLELFAQKQLDSALAVFGTYQHLYKSDTGLHVGTP